MKTKLLILILLIYSFNLAAQQKVNTSFGTQMSSTFENLEKNRVPHGLLRDFAMEFTALDAFNGTVSDSSFVHPGTLKQIYKTLLFSRVNTSSPGFVQYDYFNDQWQKAREKGVITMSGLFFRYSKFLDDAYPDKINVNSNKISDKYVNGVWQNPYEEKIAFAVSPSTIIYRNLGFKVQLPQNLWYSNYNNQVQSLQVNFNDGQGYRNMGSGQVVYVQYGSEGEKIWNYKLVLTTGETLYSHSKIMVKAGINSRPYGSKQAFTSGDGMGVDTLNIRATEPYLGVYGSATVLVNYGNIAGEIRRPLIVVEGFDPGNVTAAEEPFGETDIEDFENYVFGSGSFNLNEIINGAQGVPNYQEYDIIYVNWSNGTDYLQRNAFVLQEVIKWVNAVKTSEEENVVIGQSMGGLIARYALRDMENKGIPHETRTYISQDAPHLGANFPLGYQAAVRHARNQYIQTPIQLFAGEVIFPLFEDGVTVSDYLYLLDEPAAKQLLVKRLDNNLEIDNNLFDQWQTEMQNMGYPEQTRNVAISNGSQCAETQGFYPNDNLLSINGNIKSGLYLDMLNAIFPIGRTFNNAFFLILTFSTGELGFLTGLLPGNNKLNAVIDIKALPNFGSSAQIYRGNITFTKKVLLLININTTITNDSYTSPANILSYDYFPGGVYSTNIPSSSQSKSNVLYNLDLVVNSDPDFSFIPTPSALDIGGGNTHLNTNDYLKFYGASSPPPSPKDTPFVNFITSYNETPFVKTLELPDGTEINITNFNQGHLDLFETNGDWLANEIQGQNLANNIVDCSFLCDSTEIIGSDSLCSSGTYSVNAFGDSIINWSVDNSSAVSLSSTTGNSVTLTTSGSTRTTITLTATIFSARCQANYTENLTIRVGAPGVPSYLMGPSTVATGAVVDYQAGLSEGATSYEWRLPYPYTTVSIFDYSGQNWQLQAPGTSRYAKAFTGYAKTNGYVQVMGKNACGTGGAKLLYVTHGTGGGGSIASIDEPSDNVNEVAISPNPASTKVNVRLSKLTEYEGEPPTRILGIKVLDQNSRERKFYQYNEHLREVEINVAFLTRGLNFLIVVTDQGSFTKKLLNE